MTFGYKERHLLDEAMKNLLYYYLEYFKFIIVQTLSGQLNNTPLRIYSKSCK